MLGVGVPSVVAEDPTALDLGSNIGYEIGKIVSIRTETGDLKRCRSETGLAACFETYFRLMANRKIFLSITTVPPLGGSINDDCIFCGAPVAAD
jgi:hypothetical protein